MNMLNIAQNVRDGLELRVANGNKIDVHPECKFLLSRIHVDGVGNYIEIGSVSLFKKLFINIKGNNKNIIIKDSHKNINELKIVSIRGDGQLIKIGNSFSCGGCEIQMNDGDEKLNIGDDCLFSWGIKMRTSDGHTIYDMEEKVPLNFPQNISIGNHVWICEDVKLLKGANIPNNCIVGSGSIISSRSSSFPENSIIAGIPAGVLKSGVNWDHVQPSKFKII